MYNFAYEAYLYFKSLKQQTTSKINQRALRLSKLNYKLPYLDYYLEIRQQWKNQPDYPKYEPTLPDSPFPNLNKTREIKEDNYIFTGLISFKESSLYGFVKEEGTSLSTYKFLYALVNTFNINELSSKLPSYFSWNTNGVQNNLLEAPAYFPGKVETFGEFLTFLTDDLTHPFLPNFYFTGRVFKQKQTLGYEYYDSKGLVSVQDQTYLSPYRPYFLDFPLGQPNFGELEQDSCNLIPGVSSYPNAGNVSLIGKYTGYRTTNLYHASLIYYLYEREDGSAFLQDAPPAEVLSKAKQVLILSQGVSDSLNFYEEESLQTLKISQASQVSETFIFN